MIEVELPDGSTAEFPEGTSNDTIAAALRKRFMVPEPKGTGEDVVRSAASGVARSLPKTLDFASGVGGEIVNQAAGLIGAPKAPFGEIYKNSDYFNAGASKILGQEYEPATMAGSAAKFGGEVFSPAVAASGAKAAIGFGRGLTGKTAPLIKDPAILLQRYKEGVDALSGVKFTPKQLRDGLKKPVNEAIAPDFFANKSPELANDLSNLERLATTGTDGRRLEGFRRSLSNTKDPLANRLREGVDNFLESEAVPTAFRDNYRLMSKVRNLDDADTKGGDNLPMARTALKNQLIGRNAKGYTPAELASLRKASKAGVGESSLRLLSAVTGAPASIAAGINGGALTGGLMHGASRGLKSAADRAGLKRIEDARNLILNGGEIPTAAERFGAFVRGKIK